MSLFILEEALKKTNKTIDKKDFSRILRDSRDAIGLKLYRAAEFMGVAPSRLKNLETGYFRVMPTEAEIEAISDLYEIPIQVVQQKAKSHVVSREKVKKIRTIND